jgi:hypothetical protein
MIVVAGHIENEIQYAGVDTSLPRTEASLEREKRITLGLFANPERATRTSLSFLEFAEDSRTTEKELALCAAVLAAEAALTRSPADPQLHLLFAAIWREGRNIPCMSRFSSTTVNRAVNYALERAPHIPGNNFSAAQWFLSQGKTEQMIQALRRYVSNTERTTPFEESFVLAQLSNEERFHRIIPSQFPQILQWASLLRKRKPVKFDSWQTVVNKKIGVALDLLEKDLDSKRLSLVVAQQFLLDCYELKVAPDNWSRVDNLHAVLADRLGQKALGSYLRERAALLRVPVVPGIRKHDLRPESGELTNWGSIERVRLGESSLSVGLFVPRGWKIGFIEIYPDAHGMTLNRSGIRLFVSNDNNTWIAIDDPVELHKVIIDKQSTIILRYKAEYFPYLKILYSGGRQENVLANIANRLFRVYGVRG